MPRRYRIRRLPFAVRMRQDKAWHEMQMQSDYITKRMSLHQYQAIHVNLFDHFLKIHQDIIIQLANGQHTHHLPQQLRFVPQHVWRQKLTSIWENGA